MTHGPSFYEQQARQGEYAAEGVTPPPDDRQFRWLRIEHADGHTRDWPYLWFTADELAAMTPEEVDAARASRDQTLWYWAENLELGHVEGPKVARIVAEWIGPLGSQPPAPAGP